MTVLLVSQGEPDVTLGSELEKQGLSVEYSDVKEFESLLALVEPALVVHIGQDGAARTAQVLGQNKDERRVRLLLIAERKDLAELRALDRSVVVSLLASDIAQPVIATRIVMLAKKGPGKSGAPSASMAAQIPVKIPSLDKQPKILETVSKAPEAPPRASAKAPPTASSLSPRAPLGATPATSAAPRPPPRTAPNPSAERVPAAIEPSKPAQRKTAEMAAPLAPPRAVSLRPSPTHTPSVPNVSKGPTPVQRPAPSRGPSLVKETAAPETATPSPHEAVTQRPQSREEAEAPPPVIRQTAQRPTQGGFGEARAIVAETNMTRGDLIACALREAGIETRLVPLDAAQTNWPVVRAFRPTLVLADGHSLKGPGQVWLQLFQADQALKSAKIVAVPFERVFNDQEGSVNLRTLIPQIPQLSRDAGRIPEDARVTRPPPAPVAAHDEEDDRPTFIGGGAIDLAMDEETVATDVSQMVAEIRGKRSEGPKLPLNLGLPAAGLPPEPESIPGTTPEAPPLELPPTEVTAPAPDIFAHVDKAAKAANTATTMEKPSRRGAKFATAAVLLAALGGGGYFLYQKKVNVQPSTSSPEAAPVGIAPVAKAEAPETPKEVAEETSVLPGDPMWAIGPDAPMKDCEALVVDLEAAKNAGVQASAFAWSKARQALMRGGYEEAHLLLCQAALGHKESLALEELVELYLIKHQPDLAARWIAEAQKARPERSKTLELVGDVQSQKGEPAQAKTTWVKALKISESDQKTLDLVAKQYVDLALQKLRSGGISAAEALLRRAATLSPTNADAAAGMAAVFAPTAYKKTAKAWAEKALELRAGHSEALTVLADLEAEAGNKSAALELYKQVLESDPNHKHARLRVFSMEGQLPEGLQSKAAPSPTPKADDSEAETGIDSTSSPSPAPSDAKPADAKPADAKPADAKPSDSKPADTKASDTSPGEAATP